MSNIPLKPLGKSMSDSPLQAAPVLPTLSAKGSYGSELPAPAASRRMRWSWPQVEHVLWAAVPIIFFLLGIVLLVVALFQTFWPYLKIVQIGGTGSINFGILQSCAVAPGETVEVCTGRALDVHFTESLIRISPGIPGSALMFLPFRSSQSQTVFVVALALLITAFALYLPVWTLLYFPEAPMPARVKSFIRDHPKRFYQIAGALSFVAMMFSITIGLGYKLLLISYILSFNTSLLDAYTAGQVGVAGRTLWDASIGRGFDLVWAACVFIGLTTLGIQVSIHQCMHERIERYGEEDYNTHSGW